MNIKKQIPRSISALLSFTMVFGNMLPAYATEDIITENLLEETELNETGLNEIGLNEIGLNEIGLNEIGLNETGLNETKLDETEQNETELEETELDETGLEETEPEEMELNDTELSEDNGEDSIISDGNIEVLANSESRYETVEVGYSQSSSYFVTIPKTIVLGTDKRSPYSIKVEGDIVANKQVCVVPVDGIEETEVFDFYMSDQIAGSTKDDVVAEVSQSKFYWNHEEAANGYEENDNHIIADGLSAGRWKGTFQFEISMRTDPTHIHNYVGEVTKEPTCTEPGEKTYICDCGDSYTETIDPTGHHYEKGECTICGEKDPDHEHSYTEVVTKQPTCTEDGERTYTCDCGDSYIETIPATGHYYVDGECEHCGEKDPDAHTHSYTEKITKEPTCTEEGEKTYICDCGDSYTEVIPATGHHFGDDDKCTDCGELNPEHKHNYTETITKEPTCTEEGEKTYTCDCGDSYTEVIPATGHNYVDGTCTNCGEEDPCSKSHTDEDGDDVCDICGHTHEWEENTDNYEWVKAAGSSASNMLSQNGDTWTAKYTSNTYTINGYWDITVPEDVEYTFAYSAGFFSTNDSVNIYVDNDLIVNFANYSKFGSETISLSKGEHRIRLTFNKKNTALSSTYASITLNPVSVYNHKCIECDQRDYHCYEERITKPSTCTETGEKEFVCTKCGYSYTEEMPVDGGQHVDENGDDVCDKCGHKHIWEENTDIISWTKNSKSSTSNMLSQNGNTWKANYDTSNQYSTYKINGYWDIEVPEDMEYTFAYNTGLFSTDDRARIYLDGETIIDVSADTAGSKLKTVYLTKGEHTIHMLFEKNNNSFTSTYAAITLEPITDYNHVCGECNEKDRHLYIERIIKEPSCAEKGEKEYTCTKCGFSLIEEIEATGEHHYVDGVCDKCGDLKLVSKTIFSAVASTSTTTDSGGGHYDRTDLAGTYSPNIEITEDMGENEYLTLDFYVGLPFYGGAGHKEEVDGVNGVSMLQKYDEETDTWETIYSYGLAYSTIGSDMLSHEGGYGTSGSGNGIRRDFQLEKGTYRVYGRFSAGRGCGSATAHHYYSYRIEAILCQLDNE